MSVRRRKIRTRVERKRKRDAEFAEQGRELDYIKQALDEAAAEGLTTISDRDLSKRVDAIRARAREVKL